MRSRSEWCLYLAALLLLTAGGTRAGKGWRPAIPYQGKHKCPLDHPPLLIRSITPGEWNDEGELTSFALNVQQFALGVHYFIDLKLKIDVVVGDRFDHVQEWTCSADFVLDKTEAVTISLVLPCATSSAGVLPRQYEVRVDIYDLHPELAEEDALLATKQQPMVVEAPQWSTALDDDLQALLLRHAPHKVLNSSELHIGHRWQHPTAQAVELSISIATHTSSSSMICVEAEGLSLGAEYLLSLTISCAESHDSKQRQGEDREWSLPDRLFVHADELQQLRLTWLVQDGGGGGEDGPICQFMTITARIADCFPRSNGEAPLLLASTARVAVVTSGLFEEVIDEEKGEEGKAARARGKAAITCNSTIFACASPSSASASSATSQTLPWSGRGEGGGKGDGDGSCRRVAVVVHGQRCSLLPPTFNPSRPLSERLSQPLTLPAPSLLRPSSTLPHTPVRVINRHTRCKTLIHNCSLARFLSLSPFPTPNTMHLSLRQVRRLHQLVGPRFLNNIVIPLDAGVSPTASARILSRSLSLFRTFASLPP
jgi:hypothetical protein